MSTQYYPLLGNPAHAVNGLLLAVVVFFTADNILIIAEIRPYAYMLTIPFMS